jgi:hypothetical protein
MDAVAVESNFDRPVAIGPERLRGADAQPLDRRRRRMAVRIAEPRRHDGDAGFDDIQKRLRARRSRPVMGDLQEVDLRQPAREELGIDLLLDVAGQEKPSPADLAEEHDRNVVDRAAAVGRAERHAPRVGPEHAKSDVVERQPVARRERSVRRPTVGKERGHGCVARPRANHARLVDPADPIAAQEDGETRRVVLVRMGEDEGIDPMIPGGEALIEGDQEAARVRPAVDEHPTAAAAFDEDRVALADVEHDDPGRPVRTVADREGQCDRRAGKRDHGDGVTAASRRRARSRCGRRSLSGPLLRRRAPAAQAAAKSSE